MQLSTVCMRQSYTAGRFKKATFEIGTQGFSSVNDATHCLLAVLLGGCRRVVASVANPSGFVKAGKT